MSKRIDALGGQYGIKERRQEKWIRFGFHFHTDPTSPCHILLHHSSNCLKTRMRRTFLKAMDKASPPFDKNKSKKKREYCSP
jgi:hypothetical protein